MKKAVWCFLFVILVFSCRNAGDERRMAQIIAEADSMNRNFVPMTNDSLLREACRYYDRHGTPNQRMMAHYLLGCVYRDRGEAPEALEAYHTAADCADTTASDCDYRRLSIVHAQASDLFAMRNLPYEVLEELSLWGKYAALAGDTFNVIAAYSKRADAYDIMGIDDSVISIREKVYNTYREMGDSSSAAKEITCTIGMLIDRGETEKAGNYLKEAEAVWANESDKNGNINGISNIFYYLKGKYYLATAQLDSSEFMFRKTLRLAQNANDMEAGYHGLYQLYHKKHQPDSASKYAELSYIVCDSVYKDDNMERLQQMQSLYNYNIHRQAAIQKDAEAKQAKLWIVIIIILFVLVLSGVFHFVLMQQRKKKSEIEKIEIEHRHHIRQMRQAQEDIQTLHERQYEILIREKNESISSLQQQLEQYVEIRNSHEQSTLEERLHNNPVFIKFQEKLQKPNSFELSIEDWQQLRDIINNELPHFYGIVNSEKPLNQLEYNLCMLIRLGFQPKEQIILLGLPLSYNITVFRRRLLKKAFGIDDSPKELDKRILAIS